LGRNELQGWKPKFSLGYHVKQKEGKKKKKGGGDVAKKIERGSKG